MAGDVFSLLIAHLRAVFASNLKHPAGMMPTNNVEHCYEVVTQPFAQSS